MHTKSSLLIGVNTSGSFLHFSIKLIQSTFQTNIEQRLLGAIVSGLFQKVHTLFNNNQKAEYALFKTFFAIAFAVFKKYKF